MFSIQDMKDVLLKFEAVEGLLYVVMATVLWFFPHYAISVAAVYLFITGLYKLFVNRVKQAVAQKKRVNAELSK